MARSTSLDRLAYYGIVLGVGYVGYQLALQGALGEDMKSVAIQIKGALRGGTPPTSQATLKQQMIDWQNARQARGENPNDWPAFRAHIIALGGSDPGATAPSWLLFYAKG